MSTSSSDIIGNEGYYPPSRNKTKERPAQQTVAQQQQRVPTTTMT